MESLLSGISVLDAQKLSIRDLGQASEFIKSYGYDWDSEEDRRTLISFYRQAVAFIGDLWAHTDDFRIPEELTDLQKLGDLRNILIYASMKDSEFIKRRNWCCSLLKVMHIIAHLNNDLYAVFREEIRKQILGPMKERVFTDDVHGGAVMQGQNNTEKIRLSKFEIKPSKNQSSSIVKLLAKRKLVALNILDRVGVRFVTRNTFDIFRVIRFLVSEGLVSYPHAIVNESVNTVYPADLFLETMDTLRSAKPLSEHSEVEEALNKKLIDQAERAKFNAKESDFSDANYRFIKFISRKIINIDLEYKGPKQKIRFFYPFEVQIMDYDTHIQNMRGPLSHNEYKKRQLDAAYIRLFGKK